MSASGDGGHKHGRRNDPNSLRHGRASPLIDAGAQLISPPFPSDIGLSTFSGVISVNNRFLECGCVGRHLCVPAASSNIKFLCRHTTSAAALSLAIADATRDGGQRRRFVTGGSVTSFGWRSSATRRRRPPPAASRAFGDGRLFPRRRSRDQAFAGNTAVCVSAGCPVLAPWAWRARPDRRVSPDWAFRDATTRRVPFGVARAAARQERIERGPRRHQWPGWGATSVRASAR